MRELNIFLSFLEDKRHSERNDTLWALFTCLISIIKIETDPSSDNRN